MTRTIHRSLAGTQQSLPDGTECWLYQFKTQLQVLLMFNRSDD